MRGFPSYQRPLRVPSLNRIESKSRNTLNSPAGHAQTNNNKYIEEMLSVRRAFGDDCVKCTETVVCTIIVFPVGGWSGELDKNTRTGNILLASTHSFTPDERHQIFKSLEFDAKASQLRVRHPHTHTHARSTQMPIDYKFMIPSSREFAPLACARALRRMWKRFQAIQVGFFYLLRLYVWYVATVCARLENVYVCV